MYQPLHFIRVHHAGTSLHSEPCRSDQVSSAPKRTDRLQGKQTEQVHAAHMSRIMKLVAQTSSSRIRQVAPSSRASWMLAAWLVLPLASAEVKLLVSLPARRPSRPRVTQQKGPATC